MTDIDDIDISETTADESTRAKRAFADGLLVSGGCIMIFSGVCAILGQLIAPDLFFFGFFLGTSFSTILALTVSCTIHGATKVR